MEMVNRRPMTVAGIRPENILLNKDFYTPQ